MAFRNTENRYMVRIHSLDKEFRAQYYSEKGRDIPLEEMAKTLREIADTIDQHYLKVKSEADADPQGASI